MVALTWEESYRHQVGRRWDAANHHTGHTAAPRSRDSFVWPERPLDCSAIKRKALESVLMRWLNLGPIIQSGVGQKEIY